MADFPPDGPVTLTGTIPSYLYKEYADDENLRAFVAAFNQMAQEYVSWFANTNLAFYVGDQITGDLLDWVGAGLYGMLRPTLPFGRGSLQGPYNTYRFNSLGFNQLRIRGPLNYYATSDDAYKRILTWHLQKGDGKEFNVRWLKRRVMRFLTGENGGPGVTDQTYQVSVTFGVDGQVNINLQSIFRVARGGALFNASRFNAFRYNDLITESYSIPISPMVPVFKAAVDAGVLELPFQNSWVVNI